MPSVTLDSRLDGVVGARTAKALERAFELRTAGDLLSHFPRRYSNRGELTPLTTLPIGEHVSVVAQVIDVRERTMQRRRGSLLEVRVTDGVGELSLTFFNQGWRAKELLPGRQGIFAGKVTEYRGRLQLQHPDYALFVDRDASDSARIPGARAIEVPGTEPSEELSAEKSMELKQAAALAFSERPIPIYPATAQLASWTIEQAVAVVLDSLEPVEDPLPRGLVADEGIFALGPALELIHRPERAGDWRRARDSMRFREAFELQLALLERRRRAGLAASTSRPAGGALLAHFDAGLPFELTGDQRRAGDTISAELAAPHPMHRLLQGDVGSGKTIVALRAMLQVAEGESDGGQSAMIAPTEVLAAQHFRSIVDALGPVLVERLDPVLLTGRMPAKDRKRALLSIASGGSRIVVGTHALLGEKVTFYDLGLIVVDEQHRFGVEQREALRLKGTVRGAGPDEGGAKREALRLKGTVRGAGPDEGDAKREALRLKGSQPHVLAMTATPIPRTVALTAFGDLAVSTIRELPPGRQGIETFAVPELEMPRRAARVWARMAEDLAAGRQVYVVCPAISSGEAEEGELGGEEPDATGAEASETPGSAGAPPLASVEDTVAELRARPEFAGIPIAALHGGLSPDEKDRVMRAFSAGEIRVLVATTVIEVGVNVPNASIMIVRDADRFGVSQLHQLRGRVGRGEHAGLCLLMTKAPQGTPARARIEAVEATTDGFALAEVDLELRREGDILGTAQSGGRSTLRLLRVAEDGELIVHAREVASAILERDPELAELPGLARLVAREAESGHLENLAKS